MTPPSNANLTHLFLDRRIDEGQGSRVALRTPTRDWSYAQVQARSLQIARGLQDRGLSPQHRALILLPEGAAWVCTFFAILRCGAEVVMVNPALGDEALAELAAYTQASLVIATPERLGDGAQARLASAYEKAGLSPPRVLHPRDISPQTPAVPVFCSHCLADQTAILLFSGGTTGAPKAVLQSHGSFAFTTKAYAQGILGIGPDDITIAAPKLHFGYATGSNLLFPFFVGASCVLNPAPCQAGALAKLVRKHRATILVQVPTMVAKMLDDPEVSKEDLSSLRLATSAGEALPLSVHQRWSQRFGIELLDGLGTAEMWHIFLTNRPGQVKPGSLGQAVPGFEIQLVNKAGQPVARGEMGWLWVKGGALANGYWRCPAQETEAFQGDWYRSQDLLRQDDEGYYYYCGRSDDLMKVSGKWLAPADVESALLLHPQVASAVVVAAQDDQGLQKPYAFVTLSATEQGTFDAQAVRAFVAQKLEPFKSPRAIFVAKHWPLTHLGKSDRAKLKALVPQLVSGQLDIGPQSDLRQINPELTRSPAKP